MTPEQKAWIDGASYEALLHRWRFAASGDPFFQGETGDYYKAIMVKKRSADPAEAVAASKRIGWSKPQ